MQPVAARANGPSFVWLAAIFLLAAATLAFEIFLLRLFSLTQWHHFAALAISLALLGFGVGGTIMTLAGRRLMSCAEASFVALATLTGVAMAGAFVVQQSLPFRPLFLIWEVRQIEYLLLIIVCLFIPFLLSSVALVVPLSCWPQRAGMLYASNLFGSGTGAVGVLALLFLDRPSSGVFLIGAIAVLAALSLCAGSSRRLMLVPALGLLALGGLWVGFGNRPLNFSDYKALSHLLRLPGAKVTYRNNSPQGLLQIVEADAFRQAQALSLRFTGALPPQKALVTDADSVSAIDGFQSLESAREFYNWQLDALPYLLTGDGADVLVLGIGGGSRIGAARAMGANSITAVDPDARRFWIISKHLGEFTGLAGPPKEIAFAESGARPFLERARRAGYSLVVADASAPGSAGPGVQSLAETPLLTVEGIAAALRAIKPEGFLAITCALRQPPRDFIKLTATVIAAARRSGIDEPADHLALVRTWDSGLLVFAKSPLTPTQLEKIRRFCDERSFDPAWLPDVRPEETNRFNQLERPYYYEAAKALLSPKAQDYLEGSVFDLRPPSDSRPYFFSTWRWLKTPEFLREMGRDWLPYADWAGLFLGTTIVLLFVLSALLILLPLATSRRIRREGRPSWGLAVYFSSLGLGYLFLEMAAIQRCIILFGEPIYATSFVVGLFLFASGVGSALSGRIALEKPRRVFSPLRTATLSVAGFALVAWGVFHFSWGALLALPTAAKIVSTGIVFGVLAFAMGFPFALGIRRLADGQRENAVAWAWAFNGFASVLSPLLATQLMVAAGVGWVFAFASLFYTTAAATAGLLRFPRFPKWENRHE